MKARTTVRSDESFQEIAVEDGNGRDSPGRCPHQRPPPAVGRQPQLDAAGAAQLGQPVRRGGREPEPRTRATGESSLTMPSRRTSPDAGSVSVNDGVMTVSCSATGRARRAMSPMTICPCQPSSSSSTKAIHDERSPLACQSPCARREPVAHRWLERLQVRPLLGEHGHGQERAADVDQLEPLDVRLAPRTGANPGDPGLIGPPPASARRTPPRPESCAA